MQKISLSQNEFALVDDADYEFLSQWKWTLFTTGRMKYAYRKEGRKTILMHRVLLNTPNGMRSDHEDGNGLNNQRYNLRILTVSQNARNNHRARQGLTGVRRYKKLKLRPWNAWVRVEGRHKSLGQYATEDQARQVVREYNNSLIRLGAKS